MRKCGLLFFLLVSSVVYAPPVDFWKTVTDFLSSPEGGGHQWNDAYRYFEEIEFDPKGEHGFNILKQVYLMYYGPNVGDCAGKVCLTTEKVHELANYLAEIPCPTEWMRIYGDLSMQLQQAGMSAADAHRQLFRVVFVRRYNSEDVFERFAKFDEVMKRLNKDLPDPKNVDLLKVKISIAVDSTQSYGPEVVFSERLELFLKLSVANKDIRPEYLWDYSCASLQFKTNADYFIVVYKKALALMEAAVAGGTYSLPLYYGTEKPTHFIAYLFARQQFGYGRTAMPEISDREVLNALDRIPRTLSCVLPAILVGGMGLGAGGYLIYNAIR